MTERYPAEELDDDYDDGTMPNSLAALTDAVVGHRIVAAEKTAQLPGEHWYRSGGLLLTLDNGDQVAVAEVGDCCAFTDVEAFLLNPELVDHIIIGAGTTDGFTTWHIYADAGDVLNLTVGWSCGNPFYYGYGFDITVIPADKVAKNG
jgi:hypothetical protein